MASFFTQGREIKELRSEIARQRDDIAALERKGFYPDMSGKTGNENNEYLHRILQEASRIVYFDDFKREDFKRTYRTNAAVFGIIDRIAKAVGELGDYLELQDENSNVVLSHPLIDLLRQPNDRYNLARFLYSYATNYLVYGDTEVYVDKEGVGKNLGTVSGMYVMQGDKVMFTSDGVSLPISGLQIKNAVNPDKITPDRWFQSFIYNMDDLFFGFSPLEAASYDCALIREGKERLNTSMLNGGVANIISPAASKDNVYPPQIAADIEKDLNDHKNYNRNYVIKQAVDVHPVGNTPADLNILSTDKESVTALCFVYGIPVDLYYGQSKYENAKEAKKALYESVAIPLVKIFADDIVSFFQRTKRVNSIFSDDEAGYRLVLNTDRIDVMHASDGEVLANLAAMHASINEMRAAYGYPAIDAPYANEPMLPLGTLFGSDVSDDIDENAQK